MRRFWISVASALFLAGCATAPAPVPSNGVEIAPGVVLDLPKPGELGTSLEAAQLILARYKTQTFAIEGHIKATPDRVLLIGLDSIGRQAMAITWTDGGVKVEAAPWLPAGIRPQNVLADIVLTYWPEASVRRALAGSGATLEADARHRTVTIHGKPVIDIEYQPDATADPWAGHLIYRNLAFGYELDMQTAQVTR